MIDEGRITDFEKESLNHLLFQMEFCENSAQLVNLFKQAIAMAKQIPGHASAAKAVGRWISETMYQCVQLEMPLDEFMDDVEGTKHMLADTLCKWRDEFLQEGKAEGKAEGIAEGEEKTKFEMVKRMLQENVEDAFILKIANIDQQTLDHIRSQL